MAKKKSEIPMEQWEIDMRAKLDKEILDGTYDIGFGDWVIITGKEGKINSIIEMEKLLRNEQEKSN